jgi:uncharacterized protein (TIGR02186 family)
MKQLLALLCLIALPITLPLHAEEVVLGMSKDKVAITTNFDGSEILIYGAVKRDGPAAAPDQSPMHVIVSVAGPSEPLTVWKKEKRIGIWVNTEAVEVDSAPSYYSVATSGPLDEVLKATEDLRYKVSIPQAIRSVGAPMSVENAQDFTDALIRIRKANDSYQINENTVDFSEQTLFTTSVTMPANLTEGTYQARILLTRDGLVIADYQTPIEVRKVGLERWLFSLSRQQPLVYGLLSLAIAIFAGWGASAVFSRLQRS